MNTVKFLPNTRIKNLTGCRFGRILVVGFDSQRGTIHYWHCRCDCGNERIIRGQNLKSGHSQSCGCFKTDLITKHGMGKSTEYKSWQSMKDRCLNSNHNSYKHYGSRGITICDRWKDSFANFF